MTYFIITLREDPRLARALTVPRYGTPALFDARAIAELAIKDLVSREKQGDYCVQPVFVYSNFDKPAVRVFAPDGMRVEVVSHE